LSFLEDVEYSFVKTPMDVYSWMMRPLDSLFPRLAGWSTLLAEDVWFRSYLFSVAGIYFLSRDGNSSLNLIPPPFFLEIELFFILLQEPQKEGS